MISPSLLERKRILKNICRANKQWKSRVVLSIVLMTMAIGIVVGTIILLVNHSTSTLGVFVFVCAGICFSSIPFFIALSVKNKAKYICGLPYSSYSNGMLLLRDDLLEYYFWKVGPNEPAAYSSKRAVYKDEDKYCYSIKRKDITSLVIEGDICFISGDGALEKPEWVREYNNSQETCKEFSFILAFEDVNASNTIKEWNNHG